MSELHWMRWKAFPVISNSLSIPGNEWTTLNEMGAFPGISFSFSIPGNEWTTLNEMDRHFQVYHSHFLYLEMSELHWMRWRAFPGISFSFSIPGNEWTTLNEMESISRYIQLIFYTWKWVNYTEWDGVHFQVYLTHFLYLEMSELHWMRWRAFPGISNSFSTSGNEWPALNEMENISRCI